MHHKHVGRGIWTDDMLFKFSESLHAYMYPFLGAIVRQLYVEA